MSHFTGEWLRKLRGPEVAMETAHQQRQMLIWYQLDLSSAKPLKDEDVKKTVEHMYRKVATLGVCLGTNGEELWFRKATNPEVDFKVHHGAKLEEVREYLRKYHYNVETGPMFCARLLRDCPDTGANYDDMEPSFPHKYHIIFGLHHCMTDGTSNMNIMGFFASLVNEVIEGKPINDEDPLGYFASGEETDKIILEKKVLLESDPELQKKISDDIEHMKKAPPAVVRFLTPAKVEIKTASVERVLDQNNTTKFIQRCRQEKVTVNSGVAAMINAAIVDVLVEKGTEHNSFIIRNVHTVNLRRYWEPTTKRPLGLHMTYPLINNADTPKNVGGSKFWDYARIVNEGLKSNTLSGRVLSDKAYEILKADEDIHAGINYTADYITSSMGDITPIVTIGGDHVRVTNLVRGASIQKSSFPMLISYHTFRGIFTIVIDYTTEIIEESVAERMITRIMERIPELV